MPSSDAVSRVAVVNILNDMHGLCRSDVLGMSKLAVDALPAVDAVEVVRCRDCKYAHMTYDDEVKYCDRISMADEDGDYGYALYLPGDFYCACGERRTNA